MKLTPLDRNFTVSPQITVEELPLLKQSGYRAIVNNRPDGEEPGQPAAEDLRREAERLGLAYAHIRVTPGQPRDEDARALARILADADGPVLAFCRTGNRSAKLWELSRPQR